MLRIILCAAFVFCNASLASDLSLKAMINKTYVESPVGVYLYQVDLIANKVAASMDIGIAPEIRVIYVGPTSEKLQEDRVFANNSLASCLSSSVSFICPIAEFNLSYFRYNATCSVDFQLVDSRGTIYGTKSEKWGACKKESEPVRKVDLSIEQFDVSVIGSVQFGDLSFEKREIDFILKNDGIHRTNRPIYVSAMMHDRNGEVVWSDNSFFGQLLDGSGRVEGHFSNRISQGVWNRACSIRFLVDPYGQQDEIDKFNNETFVNFGACVDSSSPVTPDLVVEAELEGNYLVLSSINIGTKDVSGPVVVKIRAADASGNHQTEIDQILNGPIEALGGSVFSRWVRMSPEQCHFVIDLDPYWKIENEVRENNRFILNMCNEETN